MASTIQVRVDDDLKAKLEDEMLEKLEKAREHAEQGMYKDAHDVFRDMRVKYG